MQVKVRISQLNPEAQLQAIGEDGALDVSVLRMLEQEMHS